MTLLNKKTLAAFVAAGFLVVAAPQVHAEEDTATNIISEETTQLDGIDSATGEEAINEETIAEEDTTSTEEVAEEETPNLIPGDFFYFTKIMLEKIQIAITFNDEKEAELLAQFATERLAEAEALLENGEDELALETITKAISTIEQSNGLTEETPISEENTDGMNEEESGLNENTEELTEETAVEEELVEETVEEELVEETTEDLVEEIEGDELEGEMRQNIFALQAAMEKVKNPNAKAALKRNIERTYAKMGISIEPVELDEVTAEEDLIVEEITEAPVENTISEEETNDGAEQVEAMDVESDEEVEADGDTMMTLPTKAKEAVKNVNEKKNGKNFSQNKQDRGHENSNNKGNKGNGNKGKNNDK